MIKTKLILVDGITGSGKSTTAQFIARQLEKNGIKARWYFEPMKDHPLCVMNIPGQLEDESDTDYCKKFMETFLVSWSDFINKIKDDDTVYIIESFFFKDLIVYPFIMDFSNGIVEEFADIICRKLNCLNPVLIHFYQKDVAEHLKLTWERRPDGRKTSDVYESDSTLFCKNRGLKGEEGTFRMWQAFTDFSLKMYDNLNLPKIQFENSAQNWDQYRKKILEFLDIKECPENIYNFNLDPYTGDYLAKGIVIRIHKSPDNRLLLDHYWPDQKLVYISENEFDVEGDLLSLRFIKEDNNEINSFKYYNKGSITQQEASIARKYNFPVLSEKELEKFCGNFYCESTKITRKIYRKNGKLYYWRQENNESLLVPITDNQLMMMAFVENSLDFELVNDKWQFTFDVKGEEPSVSLFVQKVADIEKEM